MARKLSIVMLRAMVLLLLLVDNQANAARTEIPAEEPAPAVPLDGTTQGSLQPQECGLQCDSRCSATQHKESCWFFCNECCSKCLCLPRGTYGNRESCPCYNNWKTQRGGPKCPS